MNDKGWSAKCGGCGCKVTGDKGFRTDVVKGDMTWNFGKKK